MQNFDINRVPLAHKYQFLRELARRQLLSSRWKKKNLLACSKQKSCFALCWWWTARQFFRVKPLTDLGVRISLFAIWILSAADLDSFEAVLRTDLCVIGFESQCKFVKLSYECIFTFVFLRVNLRKVVIQQILFFSCYSLCALWKKFVQSLDFTIY